MKRLVFILFLMIAISCGSGDDFVETVLEEDNIEVPHTEPDDGDNDGDAEDENNDDTNEDSEDDNTDEDMEDDSTSSNNPPSVPTLVFPLNETECSNSDLVFEWNSSTDADGDDLTYTLSIDTSPNFDENLQTYPDISETSFALDLSPSTALYWKVGSKDAESSSESEIWSLYTQGEGTSNSVPQLEYIQPNDKEVFNELPLIIEWRGTDNETINSELVYKLYLSEVGQELELRLDNVTQTSFTLNDLNRNTTYQWAVYVTDPDGATNVGEVYTFDIQ